MWYKLSSKLLTLTFSSFYLAIVTDILALAPGPPRGGQGGQSPRGSWASRRLMASVRPAEGPWAREGSYRNDSEKLPCEALKTFFFEDHLISTGKTVRISVKTFFFLRSHHFSDQTAAFSPSILDFTKPEIRHIWAGPGPTFGSRPPWLALISQHFWSNRNYTLFTDLPWPEDSEGTFMVFESSCHLPTCLPHTVEASHCPFYW